MKPNVVHSISCPHPIFTHLPTLLLPCINIPLSVANIDVNVIVREETHYTINEVLEKNCKFHNRSQKELKQ